MPLPREDRTACLCCLQDAAYQHIQRQIARVKKRATFEYRLSSWPRGSCQRRRPRWTIRGNGSRVLVGLTDSRHLGTCMQHQRPPTLKNGPVNRESHAAISLCCSPRVHTRDKIGGVNRTNLRLGPHTAQARHTTIPSLRMYFPAMSIRRNWRNLER